MRSLGTKLRESPQWSKWILAVVTGGGGLVALVKTKVLDRAATALFDWTGGWLKWIWSHPAETARVFLLYGFAACGLAAVVAVLVRTLRADPRRSYCIDVIFDVPCQWRWSDSGIPGNLTIRCPECCHEVIPEQLPAPGRIEAKSRVVCVRCNFRIDWEMPPHMVEVRVMGEAERRFFVGEWVGWRERIRSLGGHWSEMKWLDRH